MASHLSPVYAIAITAFAAGLAMSACTTAPSWRKQEQGWERTWVVEASIDETYKAYKNFAELRTSNANQGIAGRFWVESYYFGSNAQIFVGFTIPCLHIELSSRLNKTIVAAWICHKNWEESAEDFEDLSIRPNTLEQ